MTFFNTVQYWFKQHRHPIEVHKASAMIGALKSYVYGCAFKESSQKAVTKRKAELKKLSLEVAVRGYNSNKRGLNSHHP
jgi:hypothetical protein